MPNLSLHTLMQHGVTNMTIVHYLGLIEQRAAEIINAFLAFRGELCAIALPRPPWTHMLLIAGHASRCSIHGTRPANDSAQVGDPGCAPTQAILGCTSRHAGTHSQHAKRQRCAG